MALWQNALVAVTLMFAILYSVSAGNIDIGECPIAGQCLQCISSRSRDVERCMQLSFLITRSVIKLINKLAIGLDQ